MSAHGHVNPNPDGSKARCGGPAICSVCALELAREHAKITAALTQVSDFPAGDVELVAETTRYENVTSTAGNTRVWTGEAVDAYAAGCRDEREKIRQLALDASRSPTWAAMVNGSVAMRQFADLIDGTQ